MPKYTPQKIPSKWREILLQIPAYDSIATAPQGSWFDSDIAQQSIDFFQECLRHVEGDIAGSPFELQTWQKAVNANLYGWHVKDAKGRSVRRYRECLMFLPRGNGKTCFVAGHCIYLLLCDNEAGAQVYGAAAEREQAALLFRHAKGMVEQEPELMSRCQIYGGIGHRSIILKSDPSSSYRVLSAYAKTKHGFNAHAVFVDELHALPDRELVDVLHTSMGKSNRKQPLMVYITTADYDRVSICNEKHDYGDKVRAGVIDDPAFLPVIYEAGREDDWKDEAVWVKANPNLGVSVSLDYLQRECKKAQDEPAYENTFRRLHLNQKTSTNAKCIPMDQWDACASEINIEQLAGRTAFFAIDIGSKSDFTALAMLFPRDDAETVEVPNYNKKDGDEPDTVLVTRRSYDLAMRFWLPEKRVKRDARMERQIDTWIRHGLIYVTPGSVVDYDVVLASICDLVNMFAVSCIGIDYGMQAVQFSTNLQKVFGDHFVKSYRQGVISMAAPFREMFELLAMGRLHHDGNPVMRWMASNTVAEERGGGLTKPSKQHSEEKIDGITALVMALGLASQSASSWWQPGDGM